MEETLQRKEKNLLKELQSVLCVKLQLCRLQERERRSFALIDAEIYGGILTSNWLIERLITSTHVRTARGSSLFTAIATESTVPTNATSEIDLGVVFKYEGMDF